MAALSDLEPGLLLTLAKASFVGRPLGKRLDHDILHDEIKVRLNVPQIVAFECLANSAIYGIGGVSVINF